MSVLQRFRDWRHERYIQRLTQQCRAAQVSGDRVMARMYWRLLLAAINARSPERVARMERRMGIL